MSSKFFTITEHIVPCQHIREYANNVREDQEALLRLHVKQYTPKSETGSVRDNDSRPAITILATHGNGFPKEASEALWDELLSRSKSCGFDIHSIWMADSAHQGQSYVLNESQLSDDISWIDHSRDLLHMVNHFRTAIKRPIVGIGHSMGAAQLVHLATFHPRLLSGLILLDPVVSPYDTADDAEIPYPLANASTYRRDMWTSRSEAAKAIRRAPMFASWDNRAWEAFVRHGLRDLPTEIYPDMPTGHTNAADPPVTLTTPINMEVHTFDRPNFQGLNGDGKLIVDRKTHADLPVDGWEKPYPFYRPEPILAWDRLPSLRPATLFILGGDSFSVRHDMRHGWKLAGTGVGGSGGHKEGRSKQVVLEGVGHGVPFEKPGAAAAACAPWIGELAAEWRREQGEWLRKRRAIPIRDHLVPTDEWKRWLRPPPMRNRKKEEREKATGSKAKI